MTDEPCLIEKWHRIKAPFAGEAPPGKRDAAAQARERIRAHRQEQQQPDAPPVECPFTLLDPWSRRLFLALMRRFPIRSYRYPRQRHTAVMAQCTQRFVTETRGPKFTELNQTLAAFLAEITDRVIAEGIAADESKVEGHPAPDALPGPAEHVAHAHAAPA